MGACAGVEGRPPVPAPHASPQHGLPSTERLLSLPSSTSALGLHLYALGATPFLPSLQSLCSVTGIGPSTQVTWSRFLACGLVPRQREMGTAPAGLALPQPRRGRRHEARTLNHERGCHQRGDWTDSYG